MTNVKVVPIEPTEGMKDAFYDVEDGRFYRPKPHEYWSAMLAASPASDYVAVTKDDAKWIEDFIFKFKDQLLGSSADEVLGRLTNAFKEAE